MKLTRLGPVVMVIALAITVAVFSVKGQAAESNKLDRRDSYVLHTMTEDQQRNAQRTTFTLLLFAQIFADYIQEGDEYYGGARFWGRLDKKFWGGEERKQIYELRRRYILRFLQVWEHLSKTGLYSSSQQIFDTIAHGIAGEELLKDHFIIWDGLMRDNLTWEATFNTDPFYTVNWESMSWTERLKIRVLHIKRRHERHIYRLKDPLAPVINLGSGREHMLRLFLEAEADSNFTSRYRFLMTSIQSQMTSSLTTHFKAGTPGVIAIADLFVDLEDESLAQIAGEIKSNYYWQNRVKKFTGLTDYSQGVESLFYQAGVVALAGTSLARDGILQAQRGLVALVNSRALGLFVKDRTLAYGIVGSAGIHIGTVVAHGVSIQNREIQLVLEKLREQTRTLRAVDEGGSQHGVNTHKNQDSGYVGELLDHLQNLLNQPQYHSRSAPYIGGRPMLYADYYLLSAGSPYHRVEGYERELDQTVEIIKEQLARMDSTKTQFFSQLDIPRRILIEKYIGTNTSGNPLVTQLLSGVGGNCVAQTTLAVDVFSRIPEFYTEKGYILGVETYSNHVAPVLYHPAEGTVIDLVYGTIKNQPDTPVYHPNIVPWAMLKAYDRKPLVSHLKLLLKDVNNYAKHFETLFIPADDTNLIVKKFFMIPGSPVEFPTADSESQVIRFTPAGVVESEETESSDETDKDNQRQELEIQWVDLRKEGHGETVDHFRESYDHDFGFLAGPFQYFNERKLTGTVFYTSSLLEGVIESEDPAEIFDALLRVYMVGLDQLYRDVDFSELAHWLTGKAENLSPTLLEDFAGLKRLKTFEDSNFYNLLIYLQAKITDNQCDTINHQVTMSDVANSRVSCDVLVQQKINRQPYEILSRKAGQFIQYLENHDAELIQVLDLLPSLRRMRALSLIDDIAKIANSGLSVPSMRFVQRMADFKEIGLRFNEDLRFDELNEAPTDDSTNQNRQSSETAQSSTNVLTKPWSGFHVTFRQVPQEFVEKPRESGLEDQAMNEAAVKPAKMLINAETMLDVVFYILRNYTDRELSPVLVRIDPQLLANISFPESPERQRAVQGRVRILYLNQLRIAVAQSMLNEETQEELMTSLLQNWSRNEGNSSSRQAPMALTQINELSQNTLSEALFKQFAIMQQETPRIFGRRPPDISPMTKFVVNAYLGILEMLSRSSKEFSDAAFKVDSRHYRLNREQHQNLVNSYNH